MNKMSGMGFAIVMVILIGIGMIISAPTLIDNGSKNNNDNQQTQTEDLNIKLQEFENRINERLNNIERNGSQTNYNSPDSISNKYVCTIEGNVDENGVVVQVDSSNNYSKFVFVCEYRP